MVSADVAMRYKIMHITVRSAKMLRLYPSGSTTPRAAPKYAKPRKAVSSGLDLLSFGMLGSSHPKRYNSVDKSHLVAVSGRLICCGCIVNAMNGTQDDSLIHHRPKIENFGESHIDATKELNFGQPKCRTLRRRRGHMDENRAVESGDKPRGR